MTHFKTSVIGMIFAIPLLAGNPGFAANGKNKASSSVQSAEAEWMWKAISEDFVHFQLPKNFAKEPAYTHPSKGIYEVGYYLDGQKLENWTEQIRIVAYRGFPMNTPDVAKKALDDIAVTVREACPTEFISEPREATAKNRAAVAMGCRKLPLNKKQSAFGYYLTIPGEKNVYLVTHEIRQPALSPKAALPKTKLATWKTQIDSTLICRMGGECARKNPEINPIPPGLVLPPQGDTKLAEPQVAPKSN